MVAKKVHCETCVHFKRAPKEAHLTGCYLPEFMPVKQKENFLKQQELPGDHKKLNMRGDCAKWEPRPKKPSLWKQLLAK
ncbi:MAG: hypothetical protein ACKVWV_08240 [Planctomycetota bacterium]